MAELEAALNPVEFRVWRGVRYIELVDRPCSPEEELRDDGSRAVRTYFCEWHDRTELRRVMLGYPEIQGEAGARYIHRQSPHYHPDWVNNAGKPVLFATSFQRVEPYGYPEFDANGWRNLRSAKDVAQYGLAKVSVVYETLAYDVLEDNEIQGEDDIPDESTWKRYVEVTGQFGGQFLPLPLQTFKYADTAIPIPGQSAVLQPKGDLCVIWKRVPIEAVGMRLINPNAETFPQDEALGCVNDDDFPTGAATPFRPGTLLLVGVRPIKIRSAILERLVDIEYRFVFADRGTGQPDNRPAGHNYILRVPDGATSYEYREVVAHTVAGVAPSNYVAKTDGKNPHNWYDFAKLFRPA